MSRELDRQLLDRLQAILGPEGEVLADGRRVVLTVPGQPSRVVAHRPEEPTGGAAFCLRVIAAAQELGRQS